MLTMRICVCGREEKQRTGRTRVCEWEAFSVNSILKTEWMSDYVGVLLLYKKGKIKES